MDTPDGDNSHFLPPPPPALSFTFTFSPVCPFLSFLLFSFTPFLSPGTFNGVCAQSPLKVAARRLGYIARPQLVHAAAIVLLAGPDPRPLSALTVLYAELAEARKVLNHTHLIRICETLLVE